MDPCTLSSIKFFTEGVLILSPCPRTPESCQNLLVVVVIKAGLRTDTWGQLILLTTILNHKSCTNTSRQVLEKTLFAINAIFTQDNNLAKPKVEGSLQKTNATCSKCKTNLILNYLHRSRRHSSSQSQKRESTILSDKNKLLPNISSVYEIFGPTQCCPMVSC